MMASEAVGSVPSREKAACKGKGTDLFFSDSGPMSDIQVRNSVLKAKSICKSCEIQPECLMFAVNNGEEFGIWGGFTTRERRKHFGDAPISLNQAFKAAVWTRNT